MKLKYDVNELYKLVDLNDLKFEKHEKYDLLLWKYTKHWQYEQYWNEYTIVCRSLVTDLQGNVISPCIPKFFNWEENRHIETEDFEIYEKLDGQLVYMFYYNDELVIRSSGSFVSDVVNNVRGHVGDLNLSYLPDFTFCFELTGTKAKIVVDYPYELKLTHLTTFYNVTGKEDSGTLVQFDFAKKYNSKSFQELKERNIENEEGYVIRFSNGQRCKIKFDNYIQKHFFRFSLSTQLVWRHLRDNTLEDLIVDIPDEAFIKVNQYGLQILLQVESIRRKIEFNVKVLRTIQFERKELFEFVQRFNNWQIVLASYDGKSITESIYKLIEPEFELL